MVATVSNLIDSPSGPEAKAWDCGVRNAYCFVSHATVVPMMFGAASVLPAMDNAKIAMWNSTGERIAMRIKQDYIRAILRQARVAFRDIVMGNMRSLASLRIDRRRQSSVRFFVSSLSTWID